MANKKITNLHHSQESRLYRYLWAFLRIGMGGIFFWAFLDKLLGLSFSTAPEQAWLAGSSPTSGFLSFATRGPLAGFYQGMAGSEVVDVLFMSGLLLIGIALLYGVGVRIAGYSGAVLMLLMWSAAFPPEHNPFLDEHLIYAGVLVGLATVRAGRFFGLGQSWKRTALVKRYPSLE